MICSCHGVDAILIVGGDGYCRHSSKAGNNILSWHLNQRNLKFEIYYQICEFVVNLISDMIANNLNSSIAIHPGEMIKDEIEYRGIPQKALAAEIGLPASVLNEVLNGKRAVTTEYALLLEAALGIEADLWLRLQTEYNKQVAKSNPSFMARLEKIRQVAAFL